MKLGAVLGAVVAALLMAAALLFVAGCEEPQIAQDKQTTPSQVAGAAAETGGMGNVEKATFGAGCFWHVEETFRCQEGVVDTRVGFMGGTTSDPSYKEVCTDRTGHAEVVEVTYDPAKISYEKLLEVFWSVHDPTQVNRQGPDHGSQYRSVVFYHTPEQKQMAESSKQALGASGKVSGPIATLIDPAGEFWMAEDYHQQYLSKRGGGTCRM